MVVDSPSFFLIRWRHPARGLVPPAEFMPVVNTSSISERIAAWVLESGEAA
jgi:EAL domain-containing protein (putative c-di-GMP-specific phosphodiesterase class I)